MCLEEQADQVMWNIRRKVSNLDKYQYLMSVLESNERLFFNVLINNIFDLMPIVYTPTVGLACQKYGYIFNNPRVTHFNFLFILQFGFQQRPCRIFRKHLILTNLGKLFREKSSKLYRVLSKFKKDFLFCF